MMLKSSYFCAMMNIRKWTVDIKMYTFFALLITFNVWNLSGISEYAKVVGHHVSPWIFPHLLVSPTLLPVFGCFALLLFSNAPFIDKQTPFVVIRTGRVAWILGQLLYILLTSFLYTIILFIITVVALVPHIEWTTEWGTVMKTLATTTSAADHDIMLTTSLNPDIITHFSAIKATFISLGLFFLVTFFIGMTVFSLNLIVGRMTGLVTVSILIFISYFAIYAGMFAIGYKLYYFSPLSWSSMQYLDLTGTEDYPSFTYAAICLSAIAIILGILSVVFYLKRDITTAEDLQ